MSVFARVVNQLATPIGVTDEGVGMLKKAVERYLVGLIHAARGHAECSKKLRRIRTPAVRMTHVEPLLQFWKADRDRGVPLGKHSFPRIYHVQKAKNAIDSAIRLRSPVVDAVRQEVRGILATVLGTAIRIARAAGTRSIGKKEMSLAIKAWGLRERYPLINLS